MCELSFEGCVSSNSENVNDPNVTDDFDIVLTLAGWRHLCSLTSHNVFQCSAKAEISWSVCYINRNDGSDSGGNSDSDVSNNEDDSDNIDSDKNSISYICHLGMSERIELLVVT